MKPFLYVLHPYLLALVPLVSLTLSKPVHLLKTVGVGLSLKGFFTDLFKERGSSMVSELPLFIKFDQDKDYKEPQGKQEDLGEAKEGRGDDIVEFIGVFL